MRIVPKNFAVPPPLLAVLLSLLAAGGVAYFITRGSPQQPQQVSKATNRLSPIAAQMAVNTTMQVRQNSDKAQMQTNQQGAMQDIKNSAANGFQALEVGQTIGTGIGGYTRDATGIYTPGLFGLGPQKINADAASFEVHTMWPIYARDSSQVYVYGKVIAGADPHTFAVLCGYSMELEAFCAYGKDSKRVYAYTQVIEGADPATFVSLVTNNATNKNNAGRSWVGDAIDSTAYYGAYVPSQPGDVNSKSAGVRISKLTDGTPIHFSDTTKVIAVNLNTANWAGSREGLKIGSKSYYGGTYLVDGASVYTVYSACDVDATGKESNCTLEISRVNKVGARPSGVAVSGVST